MKESGQNMLLMILCLKRIAFRKPKTTIYFFMVVICFICSSWLFSTNMSRAEIRVLDHLLTADSQIVHHNGLNLALDKTSQLSSNRNSQLINNDPKSRHSYELWKEIKLKPEYKKGKVTHVRFGEPLQLFSVPKILDEVNLVDREFFKLSAYPFSNGMVDCKGLILGYERVSEDKQSLISAAIKRRFQKTLQSARDSCEQFHSNAGYMTSSLTSEEATFPIAFSILIFKDYEQFEILLRSIYRPQNIYCVHIDKKASDEFRKTVEDLLKCFDNVFIASTSINVEWGTFTVLEPDIVCLRELFRHKRKWKYFINLTGQEMPLRTNFELVKILKAFNGANNVGATRLDKFRLKQSGLPPHGVNPVKGAVHVMLSREFVDFMLNNQTAIDIYEWSKHVKHASEILFSTLNYNPTLAAPGSYKGIAKSTWDKNPLLARLKNWGGESHCSGKLARNICILSPDELPLIATREELFANKLHFDYHPEMLVCVPELIFNRTVDEYNGLLLFDDTYYKTRDFVTNRF